MLLATLNFNFDIAALLDQGRRERQQVGYVGPLAALRRGGHEHAADRRSRGSSDARQDERACSSSQILLEGRRESEPAAEAVPAVSLPRDDRGADGLLSVGTTPLLRAAKAGDIPAMKLLIEHGANVNLPTATGITPLMAAAGNGSIGLDTRGRYKTEAQAIEAVQLLVKSGANINARDRNGQTALHGAAGWGWNNMVKALVANKDRAAGEGLAGSYGRRHRQGLANELGPRNAPALFPETEALLRQLMASSASASSAAVNRLRRSARLALDYPLTVTPPNASTRFPAHCRSCRRRGR